MTNTCSDPYFLVAVWLIVALLLALIILAIFGSIWSECRRARPRTTTGRFEVTRTVVANGLTPEQQRELQKVLAEEGFAALERRVDEMKYDQDA